MIRYIMILFFGAFILQACQDATFQPEGNYISGYVKFVDTNYAFDGSYRVALYPTTSPLSGSSPCTSQIINMEAPSGSHYYRISWSGNGTYYIAVVWMCDTSRHEKPIILGTFGCDTLHNCSKHEAVAFPNFTGANYNILCWADTTKRIY